MIQSSQDTSSQVHCYVVIANAGNNVKGNGSSLTQRIQISASCKECSKVKSRKILIRTILTVTGNDCVNQLRESYLQSLIVKTCSLQSLYSPVSNQNICILQQFKESLFTFRSFHVQRNTSLISVLQIPGCILIHIQRSSLRRSGMSQRITLCRLDFNNVCATVCHKTTCACCCNKGSKLYNFYTFQ